MLLQPLVENAIKHGLEPKVDGGSISVEAQVEANMLVIRITDTGLGLGLITTSSKSTRTIKATSAMPIFVNAY